MAPGRNSYRVRAPMRAPVFDARERRLAPEKRWPWAWGFTGGLVFSLAVWALLYFAVIHIF